MKIDQRLIPGVASVALGILFITLKGGVIGIVLTVIGLLAVAMGVSDIINKKNAAASVKIVIGVLVLVLGWVFVDIALYVVAGVLIAFGVSQIVSAIKLSELCNATQRSLMLVKPIITLAAGLCLFFNKSGMIDWIFIIVGALVLAQGVISVLEVIQGGNGKDIQ